ncbi:MAG TPA: hypothetical protein DC048_15970 [Planctomycetaceae bacterium]|nr:hypothetical protein [Planctomycetaceae bacterium]
MATSWKLTGDGLEDCRFPTLADAQEVQTATEYAGDGYFAPRITASNDPPNTTAADYLAAVWPDYPGPVPAGTDPDDWFAGCCDE